MGVDQNWTRPFRYCLGLDNVVLKPNSESRAWQMKQRFVVAFDRSQTAIGRIERAHAKIGKGKP